MYLELLKAEDTKAGREDTDTEKLAKVVWVDYEQHPHLLHLVSGKAECEPT